MGDSLNAAEKLALIKRNLAEVLEPDVPEDTLDDIVLKQQRPPKVYWGTATTGRPHCGYFVCVAKIADFLRAGCVVKILLADIHGFLDNLKAPIELVEHRAKYYKFVITALLKAVGVPIEKLEFVTGSSYQLSQKYAMDVFRLSSVVTEHDSRRAGAEVVKQSDNAPLSGLIYPLMQALDEEHLGVDVQFGGLDQRKIFILAAEQLPRINYKKRIHLMNPMVPGLAGGKMSASDPDSKIDVLDKPEVVRKKLKKAQAAPKEVEGNGVISFVEFVLLPVSSLKVGGSGKFVVERREQEPLVYTDIAKLKADYEADILTPQALKPAVTEALLEILKPVQEEFDASPDWQEITLKAYPPPEVKKKEKKPKNLGTRFPGTKKDADTKPDEGTAGENIVKNDVEAKPDGHVEGKLQRETEVSTSAAEAMQSLNIEKAEQAEHGP